MSEKILPEIKGIIRDVLDQPELALDPETPANSIGGWDSVAYVQILMTIEERFNIIFEVEEVTAFETVGQLAALVERKIPPGA